MKISSVTLYQWTVESAPEEYMDIDWPSVHKECGVDHIEWIQKQDINDCMLTLEFFQGVRRLIVEFFNQEIAKTYFLMWAK